MSCSYAPRTPMQFIVAIEWAMEPFRSVSADPAIAAYP
jgi:hypothetical protein